MVSTQRYDFYMMHLPGVFLSEGMIQRHMVGTGYCMLVTGCILGGLRQQFFFMEGRREDAGDATLARQFHMVVGNYECTLTLDEWQMCYST